MKNPSLFVCLSVLAAVLGLQSVLAKDAPVSESQLLKEFDAALKAKDKESILSLYNWQGVSSNMRSFQSKMIEGMLKQDLKSVKLSPLPADFRLTNELNGIRYTFNVSVLGQLDVQFTQAGNSMRVAYGKKGGAFYLAGTTEEKVAIPVKKEKSLNIMVMGDASPDAGTFSGSYVYVKGGNEIKKELSGKGNGSEAFWGDYIKSCTVRKTSDKAGPITLTILENGQKVFESEEVETKDPIVYEKK